MPNTYSVRSRVKEKERGTDNRSSVTSRTKKSNKIICALYERNDRKPYSYNAKKPQNCLDEVVI